jgi:P27 family predicted phage terminase small subunit
MTSIKHQIPANEPPNYLEDSTKEWFRAVVGGFELEQHHVKLLIAACECWDRMQEARAAIEKHGLTMKDPKTGAEKARPEVNIERDSKIVFMKLLRELNLSEQPPDARPPKLRYGGGGRK